ncbi:MAG: STAS domain-containing protein [Candidatus Heimdallarchaeota archaeon]
MEVKVEKKENYTSVRVMHKNLDTHISPSLKSELVMIAGKGEKNIVLDVSECKYCNSSGLGAILIASRLCKNANGVFILSGLTPPVEQLIKISQLDNVLNIAKTAEEADTAMQQILETESE